MAPPESTLDRTIRSVPLLRRFFETKSGQIVIGQFPNGPVLIATALTVAAFLIAGASGLWVSRAAGLAWIYWSALEIGWGVNPFRRVLGAVVLSVVILGLVRR